MFKKERRRLKMESIKCEECGKVIEGFSSRHVNFMMSQHKLKHIADREEKILKLEKKNCKS
jgi:hypothetical protein